MAIARPAGFHSAPFAYYRLHGPRAWYRDRYTMKELAPFLEAARSALKKGDVYMFFDNTIGGHAYWNALDVLKAFGLNFRTGIGTPYVFDR